MIFKKCKILFLYNEKGFYICIRNQRITDETSGEMAERSNAAVLKTVDCNRSGGSNPSFSAGLNRNYLIIKFLRFFHVYKCTIFVWLK
jgi:hypothetical protein